MLANIAETRAIAKPAKTKIEGTLKVLCHSADDQGDSFGTGVRIVERLKSVSVRLGGQTDSDIPTAFTHSAKEADAKNLSPEEKYERALRATVSYAQDSSKHLQETLAETVGKETVVSVGGNHLRAIELIGYLRECKRLGREPVVVWCDAHPDAHTPETSDTKNLHGMVAMLLFGKGPKALTDMMGECALVKPENFIYFGINQPDQRELENLKEAGFLEDNTIGAQKINDGGGVDLLKQKIGEIHARLSEKALWWVEVDLDVLNSDIWPIAVMQNSHGIDRTLLHDAVGAVIETGLVAGLGISEMSSDAPDALLEIPIELALLAKGINHVQYAADILEKSADPETPNIADGAVEPWYHSRSVQRGGLAAGVLATTVGLAEFFFGGGPQADQAMNKDSQRKPEAVATRGLTYEDLREDAAYVYTNIHSSNTFKPYAFTKQEVESLETARELAASYIKSFNEFEPNGNSYVRQQLLSCLYVANQQQRWSEVAQIIRKTFFEKMSEGTGKLYHDFIREYDDFEPSVSKSQVLEFLTYLRR